MQPSAPFAEWKKRYMKLRNLTHSILSTHVHCHSAGSHACGSCSGVICISAFILLIPASAQVTSFLIRLGLLIEVGHVIQAKAARKRREKQRHIFFSEPVTPQAGTSCTLFYNPDITNLRGRPEIWLRGSFNRSTHPGKFGPLQMHPTLHGGSGPLKAEVKVTLYC